jgi:GNAT superfamily N-acetyltransferase
LRGQKLFVRPIEPSDHAAVNDFLIRVTGVAPAAPVGGGLLGKVVGELVAVVGTTTLDEAIRVDVLVVTGELRRKRIGGFMIEQLDALAASLDRQWITAGRDDRTSAFLLRLGFEDRGDEMRRRVGMVRETRR